jgi:hypothetical protein
MIGRGAELGTEEGAVSCSAEPGRPRKIIHIDMDAFYASVEQRDNPELRGKPVAVGGALARGVVAAASYEAREFGVHSAMPSVIAKRKCPDLIFVKPRFDAYKAISLQIREVFAEYTPIIEPLSLDEAYLDVTENLKGITSATKIAEEIRARIRAETELTASAGVSYNKFLAKLASDHRKPDGLFVITPEMGPEFVATLPVRKVSRGRAGDGQEDGATRDRNRARPQGADLGLSAATFRESGVLLFTGLRAASTSGPSAPIGYGNPSAPRTPFPPISSPTKPRVMRSGRSSIRCGNIASAPVFVAAPSRSRSSSLTSSRSREAAPVRCRSGPGANSNSSATHCLNLSFLWRKAFGSSVSHYLHWWRRRLNVSASSACCFRPLVGAAAKTAHDSRQFDTCWCL